MTLRLSSKRTHQTLTAWRQRLLKGAVVVTFLIAFLLIIGPEQILSRSRLGPVISVWVGLVVIGGFFLVFYWLAESRIRQILPFIASRSWYNMLPRKWWKSEEGPWWKFYLKVLLSTIVFFGSFLLYLLPLLIIFYLAGEPFSTDFSYLFVASSSALLLIRLVRYIQSDLSKELTKVVMSFILSFGLIAGVLLWGYLGGPNSYVWLWNEFWSRRQFLFILFSVYLSMDVAFQLVYDWKQRKRSGAD